LDFRCNDDRHRIRADYAGGVHALMTKATKRLLDAAVSELQRDGYMILLIMFDKKSDEAKPMGLAMEILCSETNDPQILAAMAKDALTEMSRPIPGQESVN
jgi:hypothetical protein